MAPREGPTLPYSNRPRRDRHTAYEEEGRVWPRLRPHIVAMSGEFIGTIMFLWFAFVGAQMAATISPDWTIDRALYASFAFGFSLLTSAWSFFRISGGLFNPALLLGLCISGQVPWKRGAFLLPAEIVGGIVAAYLASCMFPDSIEETLTTLSPTISVLRGVFVEMFLTAQLVFVVLMLAAEKHHSTFIAPIGIGFSLFVSMLAGVYYTGCSVNPARSFGPAVAAGKFHGYHWIYWVGPIAGAIVASAYYRFVKWMHYEEANPGQDAISEAEMEKSRERYSPRTNGHSPSMAGHPPRVNGHSPKASVVV